MKFGFFGKFTALPGMQEELKTSLSKLANIVKTNRDCFHYVVSAGDSSSEVYVWQLWATEESQEASLRPKQVGELFKKILPLVESMSDNARLKVLGGKTE